MTKEEIETVAKIMLQADGFCPHCYSYLLEDLAAAFPEYASVVADITSRADAIEHAYRDAKVQLGILTDEANKLHIWQF